MSGEGFAYFDGNHRRPPSPDAQRDDLVEELWHEAAWLLGSTLDPTLRART